MVHQQHGKASQQTPVMVDSTAPADESSPVQPEENYSSSAGLKLKTRSKPRQQPTLQTASSMEEKDMLVEQASETCLEPTPSKGLVQQGIVLDGHHALATAEKQMTQVR
jgi:hypothetical protein